MGIFWVQQDFAVTKGESTYPYRCIVETPLGDDPGEVLRAAMQATVLSGDQLTVHRVLGEGPDIIARRESVAIPAARILQLKLYPKELVESERSLVRGEAARKAG